MTILRVDASIQGPRSASRTLADLVLNEIRAARPDEQVISRDLADRPMAADVWATATMAGFTDPADRSPVQSEALRLAGSLADELAQADAAILALPLYNWGVSQHAKAWIDLAIAGAATGARLLENTPTVLLTTRGSAYGPGSHREGWDHSTAFLRRILADVWGADLTVIEREMTLVGVNPALDSYREDAELARKQAEEAAFAAGRKLALELGGRRAA